MIHVVSVASGNGVAGARILARGLAEHHPDWPLTVLVLPGVRPRLRADGEPFEVLEPAALDLRADAIPLGAPLRLRAALARPLLVRRTLDGGAERVLVMPPDAEVLGPLDAFERGLDDRSAVLVPRLLGRLPTDGARPDARDLLEAGEIDDELVAVRRDDVGRALVDWWAERLREEAQAAAALRTVPARLGASPLATALRAFEGVERIDDTAYDVSYWNLHERPLDDARLMRFAGFRADRPWWLSDRASRTLVLDHPALAAACGRRAQELIEAGWIVEAEDTGGVRTLPGGLDLDDRLRRLHTRALDAGEDFGDIFSSAGARAFTNWLSGPAERGAAAGITRYALDPWVERRDLRDEFTDLDGRDGERYVEWLWAHGRAELDLVEDLLPEPPQGIEVDEIPAVLVTGYLRGNLGLGEAARGYTLALRAAGVPVATSTLVPEVPVEARGGDPPPPDQREFAELALADGVEPTVNLLCVNAPEVRRFARQAGEDLLRSRYTIGQWAWEIDSIPTSWDPAFDLVDEVWVYSSYVAENIARATDVNVPVVVVPLPVVAPDAHDARVPFELPDGFMFLFAFDFFSTLERKNPLGLIEAFKRAFAPGEGPTLLLKSINARFRPEPRERLRHAIAGRDDIRLVDALLEPDEMAALYRRADCYVSLHRAEGYGLTLAESMALGKPVIATGFSGNTDFMTPANSYLVDWTLTEVGPEAEHYPAHGTWADPSLDHAAELLAEVYGDREAAVERGARAALDVAAALSRDAVGAIARDRLVRISRRRRGGAPSTVAPLPVAPDLAHRLEFDLTGGDRPGPKGIARRALFRTLRSYSASERALDRALAVSISRLGVELHADRASHARDQARVTRLERLLTAVTEQTQALMAGDADLRGRVDAQEGLATLVGEMHRQLEELMTGARAEPYMAGAPLVSFEADGFGRVLGFRHDQAGESADDAYRRFEAVFRGPRERVAELVEPYVERLVGHGPVLDVGCGRGELLERLKAAGVDARGVDSDPHMAESARAAGLEVVEGDAIDHLDSIEHGSLGAITAIHVLEHLPADALVRFFQLAHERLRPGGLLIAETINPHAAYALKTFWVDLTHRQPIFPEVAVVLADVAGFARGFIWFPRGTGDAEADRFAQDAYALVAEA